MIDSAVIDLPQPLSPTSASVSPRCSTSEIPSPPHARRRRCGTPYAGLRPLIPAGHAACRWANRPGANSATGRLVSPRAINSATAALPPAKSGTRARNNQTNETAGTRWTFPNYGKFVRRGRLDPAQLRTIRTPRIIGNRSEAIRADSPNYENSQFPIRPRHRRAPTSRRRSAPSPHRSV